MSQILEFLSLRTFSSVWYWIAVGGVWAVVSQRPIGVPYDMVWRASQGASGAQEALNAVARALARRHVGALATGGMLVVGVFSAVLTALLLLAVVYGLELAQGALFLVLPLSLVAWLGHSAAREINDGGEPVRHLRRLRMATHAIGVTSLFLTAAWGMYVNIMASVL